MTGGAKGVSDKGRSDKFRDPPCIGKPATASQWRYKSESQKIGPLPLVKCNAYAYLLVHNTYSFSHFYLLFILLYIFFLFMKTTLIVRETHVSALRSKEICLFVMEFYILITQNKLLYGTSCICTKHVNDTHSSLLSLLLPPFLFSTPCHFHICFSNDDPSDLFREVSGSWVQVQVQVHGCFGEHGSFTGSYNKGIR